MAKKPPSVSHDGIRRFLADLRAGAERRSWDERRNDDRRTVSKEVDPDRRNAADRRSGSDRRVMLLDRRRRISEPYALQHAELIREMLLNPDTVAACPRCDGSLLLGPLVSRGDSNAREVRCTCCRHSVVISHLPAERAIEEEPTAGSSLK